MTQIFISHPREEQVFALKLDNALRMEGYGTWLYSRDFDPRKNHREQVDAALEAADMQIVVATPKVLRVRTGLTVEYETLAKMGKPIITAVLYPTELPPELQAGRVVDFQRDFETAFRHLLTTLDELAPVTPSATDSTQDRVLIAYRDLIKDHSAKGVSNAAETVANYLSYHGYNVQAINYNDRPFNGAGRATIESAAYFVPILSHITLSYFLNEDDPLRQALLYALEMDRKLALVTVSKKMTLANPSLLTGGLEALQFYAPVYLPPTYSAAHDPAKIAYLEPLLKQLRDEATADVSAATASAPATSEDITRADIPRTRATVEVARVASLADGLTHHVFLSYKRQDGDTMRLVREELERNGLIVWTDELIEKGTAQWQREIERAIRHTATLVCLLSPEAAQSDYVREELAAAKLFQKPVFLAMIRGSRAENFIYGYMNSQMTDLRTEADYKREFPKLVEAIRKRV